MTEVLFYITETPGVRASLAWRIAEKAWRQQRQVYIHTASASEAEALDAHFWAEPAASFLPHALLGTAAASASPVVLGHGDNPGDHHDVLINLAGEVPDFYARFSRVAEMICGDPQLRQQGRARWAFYRDRGYPVTDHRL